MDNSAKILEEARFYLASDLNMGDAAKALCVSKRTLQLHFKKLQNIDTALFELIVQKNKDNQANQEHPQILTIEQIVQEANEYLSSDLTIEQFAEKLGESSKTIYNHFERLKHSHPDFYIRIKKKNENNYISTQFYETIPISQYLSEALEYLASDLTFKEYAEKLGIAEESVLWKYHFDKLKDNYPEIYEKIKLKNQITMQSSRITCIYTESQYDDIAREYIANDLTMEETASKLGISLSTLKSIFAKIELTNPALYKEINNKKTKQVAEGKKKGARLGKAKVRYTQEQAIAIAQTMINDELSYEEASELFNIPKSTLYEMVHSDFIDCELKDKLDVLAYSNKRKMAVSELEEENKRVRVTY